MKGNDELVRHLEKSGVLSTSRIIQAFQEIDRRYFVTDENLSHAYENRPLPIGKGQTISQPTTVAIMLELLQPQKGDRILDVGSGSGWTTALLAHIVGKRGRVFGVELVPELVALGKKHLGHFLFSQVEILLAGKELGLSAKAPFDKILISAAADELPQTLVDQLKQGGTLVIPIDYSVWKVDKTQDGSIEKQEHEGFTFVPLLAKK